MLVLPTRIAIGFRAGCQPPGWDALKTTEEARNWAEGRRLLYVACTRARDWLVVPSPPPSARTGNFWRDLQERLPSGTDADVERVDADALPVPEGRYRQRDLKAIASAAGDDVAAARWDAERRALRERAPHRPLTPVSVTKAVQRKAPPRADVAFREGARFMASSTISSSCSATCCPGFACTSTTIPAIGDPRWWRLSGSALMRRVCSTASERSRTVTSRGWPLSSKKTVRCPSSSAAESATSLMNSVFPCSISTWVSSPSRRPYLQRDERLSIPTDVHGPNEIGEHGLGRIHLETGRGSNSGREHLRPVEALVVAALEELGELENALIVFTSDNGYFYGEHGLTIERRLPYEESIRAPLLMRLPGLVPAGSRPEGLVLSIDLAATILDVAGVGIPAHVQGRSLLPMLRVEVDRVRDSMLVEFYSHENPFPWTANLDYRVVRRDRYKYIRWIRFQDEVELYDMERDPYELHNLAKQPAMAEVVAELDAEMRRLVLESLGWSD